MHAEFIVAVGSSHAATRKGGYDNYVSQEVAVDHLLAAPCVEVAVEHLHACRNLDHNDLAVTDNLTQPSTPHSLMYIPADRPMRVAF